MLGNCATHLAPGISPPPEFTHLLRAETRYPAQIICCDQNTAPLTRSRPLPAFVRGRILSQKNHPNWPNRTSPTTWVAW